MSCRSDTETYLCTDLKPEAEEMAELLGKIPEKVKEAMLNQLRGAKITADILQPNGNKRSA